MTADTTYAQLFARLLAQRRRPCCPHGHDQAIFGKINHHARGPYVTCRECMRLRKQAKLRAAVPAGLVAHGASFSEIARTRAVATKLLRYGPAQMSAEGREKQRAAVTAMLQTHPYFVARRTKTQCARGHEYNERNTRIGKRGHRECRRCAIIYQRARRQRRLHGGRPEWVHVGTVTVSLRARDQYFLQTQQTLRQTMIDAHPDKGGTPSRFIKARRALERFLDTEKAWYASLSPPLTPPTKDQQPAWDGRPRHPLTGQFLATCRDSRTAVDSAIHATA